MLKKFGIVEIGGDVAVRYTGRLFSVMGASVVRIPGPTPSIPDKSLGGGGASGEAYGRWLDEKKKTATDFQSAAALLKQEGRQVHVVIAGQNKEDVKAAETLAQSLPEKPLFAGITWFDVEGPYADWRGNDALMQALSGNAYWFGEKDGPPTISQGAMPQMLAGLNVYVAALAGLWGNRTGNPVTKVHTNIHEALLCFPDVMMTAAVAKGGKQTRPGVNKGASAEPAGIYRAKDGWFGIVCLLEPQWAAFCKLFGVEHLMSDPRFKTNPDRLKNSEALHAIIDPVFLEWPVEDIVMKGQEARIPATHVPDQFGLLSDRHWNMREAFAEAPGTPGIRAPAMPFRLTHDGATRAPRQAKTHEGPLSGIRVADFAMVWAGPLAARYFADLGADVIKIESRSYPDTLRPPMKDGDPGSVETDQMYNVLNRNKRNLTAELKEADDVEKVKKLLKTSDIVIENFAVGVMEKMGLGPEALRALNPGIIYVEMSAFGAVGPYNFFRAYGMTAEQGSSYPFANGYKHWPPAMQHLATGDPTTGIFGAAAGLIALHAREDVGGTFVDMAQGQCVFQFAGDILIHAQVTGKPYPRSGNRRQTIAPSVVVPGREADTWLLVTAEDDRSWQALCRILGRSDWKKDASLSTFTGRNRRAGEIEKAIADWARNRVPAEAAALLQKEDVPAAPVIPAQDLLTDPQLVASGYWTKMDRKYVGKHLHGEAPFTLDGKRPRLRTPAPLLGEHTEEILREIA